MREEVAELLANKGELLTVTYFKLQKLFEKKYGVNTIVLMEIGTFFEVYEVNNDEEHIGKAKEIAELLNIQLTRKNKSILQKLPDYQPTRTELKIDSLKEFITTINTLNNQVASTYGQLKISRDNRRQLYQQLTDRANRIKAYVKANYGLNPTEYTTTTNIQHNSNNQTKNIQNRPNKRIQNTTTNKRIRTSTIRKKQHRIQTSRHHHHTNKKQQNHKNICT